jgi:pyrroline-5-carboxylate reductase
MVDGAVRTFFDSGRSAEEVIDLIPVKPLAELEPQIVQGYRDALPRLHARLKGA